MELTPQASEILDAFRASPASGWQLFLRCRCWVARTAVAAAAMEEDSLRNVYMNQYRWYLRNVIREDFYDILESGLSEYAAQYQLKGEINVPLIKLTCLNEITK